MTKGFGDQERIYEADSSRGSVVPRCIAGLWISRCKRAAAWGCHNCQSEYLSKMSIREGRYVESGGGDSGTVKREWSDLQGILSRLACAEGGSSV